MSSCHRVSSRVIACHRVSSRQPTYARVRVCCVAVGRRAQASRQAASTGSYARLCQPTQASRPARAGARAAGHLYPLLCTSGMQHALLIRRSLTRVRALVPYLPTSPIFGNIILMFLGLTYGLPVLIDDRLCTGMTRRQARVVPWGDGQVTRMLQHRQPSARHSPCYHGTGKLKCMCSRGEPLWPVSACLQRVLVVWCALGAFIR